MKRSFGFILCIIILQLCISTPTFSFSFSEAEQQDQAENQGPQAAVPVASSCLNQLQDKKIGTMIGESHRDDRAGFVNPQTIYVSLSTPQSDDRFGSSQAVYGPITDLLNAGFKALGLSTYSNAQINAQIAAKEQEAFLNNDLDAALAAAAKLQADFFIKGVISTRAQTNRVVGVEELFVTISLNLVDRGGANLASVTLKETTFSDADVTGTVHRLVQDNAQYVTSRLFADYCQGRQ